jgi:hypothetical protein
MVLTIAVEKVVGSEKKRWFENGGVVVVGVVEADVCIAEGRKLYIGVSEGFVESGFPDSMAPLSWSYAGYLTRTMNCY